VPSTPFTHTHSWTIPAEPARVFRALTDAGELRQWFAEDVQVEPREKGVYRFWGRHTIGTPPHEDARQTVTRFEAPRAFAFQWPLLEVDTDVAIALAPAEGGTRLTLSHTVNGDLPVPDPRELIAEHWRVAVANLVRHLAGDRPVLPDYFGNAWSARRALP
jgi:uncharacterized protein YndB with AHSA1/START domain